MADGEALARAVEPDGPPADTGPAWLAPVYADFAPELRRFVLGVVRDPSLADDVMQATFLKMVEHGHEARPETAKGWLFRVATREALATKRRQASTDRAHRKLAEGEARPGPSPDEALIRSETVEAVRRALADLPENERRVVLARVYEGRTFAEIARGAGLPLGTVLTRMRRALGKLKQVIDPGA